MCVHECVCMLCVLCMRLRENNFGRGGGAGDDIEISFLYLLFIQVCHLCFDRKL